MSAKGTRSHRPPQVLLIVGAPGVGKTTVLDAVTELLTAHGVAHASLETEHLAQVVPRAGLSLILDALPGVWAAMRAHGVLRLVLTHTCEAVDDVAALAASLTDTTLAVVALQAPPAILRDRIRSRGEPAHITDHLLDVASRVEGVAALVNPVRLVDTSVTATSHTAQQLADVTGWLSDNRTSPVRAGRRRTFIQGSPPSG